MSDTPIADQTESALHTPTPIVALAAANAAAAAAAVAATTAPEATAEAAAKIAVEAAAVAITAADAIPAGDQGPPSAPAPLPVDPTLSAPRAPAPDTSDAGTDWSILADSRVEPIIAQVARKLAASYPGITTADDQQQEGLIWAATNAATVRQYLADPLFGERNLYVRMYSRLLNGLQPDINKSARTMPLGDVTEVSNSA